MVVVVVDDDDGVATVATAAAAAAAAGGGGVMAAGAGGLQISRRDLLHHQSLPPPQQTQHDGDTSSKHSSGPDHAGFSARINSNMTHQQRKEATAREAAVTALAARREKRSIRAEKDNFSREKLSFSARIAAYTTVRDIGNSQVQSQRQHRAVLDNEGGALKLKGGALTTKYPPVSGTRRSKGGGGVPAEGRMPQNRSASPRSVTSLELAPWARSQSPPSPPLRHRLGHIDGIDGGSVAQPEHNVWNVRDTGRYRCGQLVPNWLRAN